MLGDPKEFDFIGRYENLQQDFDHVCDSIGIPRRILPHANKSRRKPYWKYYNTKTRDIVAEIFREDIEYFGYEFEDGSREWGIARVIRGFMSR